MTTLFPRGHVGYPTYQFSSPHQITQSYYNDRYTRYDSYFAPPYPTQPLYQPPVYPYEAYPTSSFRKPGISEQINNFLVNLDNQYRNEKYNRKLNKLGKQYAKLEADYSALYPQTTTLDPLDNETNIVYQYEKETKFVPYPIFLNSQGNIVGGAGNVGYGLGKPWQMNSPGTLNLGYGTGGGMHLTPKIRVIFIPTGQSSLQQPCTGPLTMPPFLYNRISQPLCSFPLPPPLPQLGSLSLTPAVQQMVVQRYSNPVAVLPYSFNFQTPQLIAPAFQQVSSYQQHPITPMVGFQPMSVAPASGVVPSLPNVSSILSVPQNFSAVSAPALPIPTLPVGSQYYGLSSAPALALPSFSGAPQSYVSSSAPALALPSFSGAPQSYVSSSAPTASSFGAHPIPQQVYTPPSAPVSYSSANQGVAQTYIPPSAPISSFEMPSTTSQSYASSSQAAATTTSSSTMQANVNLLSQGSSQPQWSNSNMVQATSQHFNSNYPTICRACPPAPPPLSIPVIGHCWVQHCAACHHVPTSTTQPNARPSGGRMTPLLRHPTIPQYIPEQTREQQQYFQSTAPVLMRPWLRKTPPLPPGAVLISDEYVNEKDSYTYVEPERSSRRHKRSTHHKHRSTTVTSKLSTNASPTIIRDNRSVSPRKTNKSNDSLNRIQGPQKSNSAVSKTSSNVSSDLSLEYRKVTTVSSKNDEKAVPKQLVGEARNINLKYNYQPQELPSVYLLNRYLNSSSEASGSSPNPRTMSDSSSSLVKEHSKTSLASSYISSVKEQCYPDNDNIKSARSPSHLSRKNIKVVIIREFVSSSPSTMSTISSNLEFSVLAQQKESISKQHSSKTDNEENKFL